MVSGKSEIHREMEYMTYVDYTCQPAASVVDTHYVHIDRMMSLSFFLSFFFLTTFLGGTVSCPMNATTQPASMSISVGGYVAREAIIPTIANIIIQLSLLLRPSAYQFCVAGLLSS